MKSIFENNIIYKDPKVGNILVAQPFLDEFPFRHAVVYLVGKGDDGGFLGFVMDKLTGNYLNEVFEDIEFQNKIPIYYGGPVGNNRLFYIHRYGDKVRGCLHVEGDVYFSGDFNDLMAVVDNEGYNSEMLRFFVGYSGWDEGQLEKEIREQTWVVADSPGISILFNESGDALWHNVVRSLGEDYKSWLYHPLHPSSN